MPSVCSPQGTFANLAVLLDVRAALLRHLAACLALLADAHPALAHSRRYNGLAHHLCDLLFDPVTVRVLRAVLLALVERPRSTLGGVAFAAFYRCFPIAEQLVAGGTVEA